MREVSAVPGLDSRGLDDTWKNHDEHQMNGTQTRRVCCFGDDPSNYCSITIQVMVDRGSLKLFCRKVDHPLFTFGAGTG